MTKSERKRKRKDDGGESVAANDVKKRRKGQEEEEESFYMEMHPSSRKETLQEAHLGLSFFPLFFFNPLSPLLPFLPLLPTPYSHISQFNIHISIITHQNMSIIYQ